MKQLFKNKYWILIFLFLGLQHLSAQKNSNLDSALKATQQQLLESEKRRTSDSLKIELLLQQMQANSQQFPNNEEDSIFQAQMMQEIASQKLSFSGVPVVFFEDTLFYIYSSLGPYSPEKRANDITVKLMSLYEDRNFNKDSIKVNEFLDLINISYGTNIITSVSLIDAMWVDMEQDSLALDMARIIGDKVAFFKEKNSFKNTIYKFGIFALIIVLAFSIIYLVGKVFRYILKRVIHSERAFLNGIKIRNYQLLKKKQIIFIGKKVLRAMQFITTIALLYAMVPLIFSIFPMTRHWAKSLTNWLREPFKSFGNAIIDYLPSLITIIIIVFILRYVLKVLRFFTIEIQRGSLKIRNFYPEWAKPTYAIIRFLLLAFGLILIFPHLPGSDSLAFKGVSVFLGVLFSIGSSSAIANVIAGFVITYMRPFSVGDWIKTGDTLGMVLEKNALVTRLRTIDNEDITVPNSSILNSHTVNYSSAGNKEGLIISKDVTVNYDVDADLVEKLLKDAALNTPDIADSPSPFVFQKNMDTMYATFQLKAYTFKPERMYHIHSDLYKNIMHIFKEHHIDLICSQFVTLKSHEHPKV